MSKKIIVIKLIVSLLILFAQDALFCMKPEAGLDPSWMLGLSWAQLKGLSFGGDVVFTYGPLYFLSTLLINMGQPCLLYQMALHCFIYFVVIYLFAGRLIDLLAVKSWKNYSLLDQLLIIAGFVFFLFMPLSLAELILVLCCSLFIRLTFDMERLDGKKRFGIILITAALLNCACLIKFSYAIAALILAGIGILGLLCKKRYTVVACFLLLLPLLNIVFWILCGQPLAVLPDYYRYGMEISSGYTEAMSMSYDSFYIIFHLFSLFIIIAGGYLIYKSAFVKKDLYLAFSLFIISPILFMAFKEGFTREDIIHLFAFFEQLTPIVLFFIMLFVKGDFNSGKLKILTICIAYIAIIVTVHSGKTPLYSVMKVVSSRRSLVEWDKKIIRETSAPLSSGFLEKAGKETVDIIPWDIALLYAYNLNWRPRPVIQSYSAYTPVLDSINACHFKKETAPKWVVYSYKSIDGRYPLYDEPEVFRALLDNYEPVEKGDYLMLKRRNERINSNDTIIGAGVCPVGTIIDVPQIHGKAIYCNLDVSMNMAGKWANIFYKTGGLYITFYLEQQPPVKHRFIRQLGNDGLFVSKYVTNLSELCQVFENSYNQDVKKIQITTRFGFFYKSEMKYTFFTH